MLHLLLLACGNCFQLQLRSRRHSITTRRGMARLVALRHGGESASVPGCACEGTGTLYRLSSVT